MFQWTQRKPGWVPCTDSSSQESKPGGIELPFHCRIWGELHQWIHICPEQVSAGHWRMASIKMEIGTSGAGTLCLRMNLFRWVLYPWPGMTEFMQNELTELNPLQGRLCVPGLWLGWRGSGTLGRRRKQWVNDKTKNQPLLHSLCDWNYKPKLTEHICGIRVVMRICKSQLFQDWSLA